MPNTETDPDTKKKDDPTESIKDLRSEFDLFKSEIKNEFSKLNKQFAPEPPNIHEYQPQSTKNTQFKTTLEAKIAQLAEERKLDPKDLEVVVQLAKEAIKEEIIPIKNTVSNFDLTLRFANLYSKYPFARKLDSKMKEVYNNMDSVTKEFVLNSPSGVQFLYTQTKDIHGIKEEGPPTIKSPESSSSFSGPKQEEKLAENQTLLSNAVDLLSKGDRVGYEKAMLALKGNKI